MRLHKASFKKFKECVYLKKKLYCCKPPSRFIYAQENHIRDAGEHEHFSLCVNDGIIEKIKKEKFDLLFNYSQTETLKSRYTEYIMKRIHLL